MDLQTVRAKMMAQVDEARRSAMALVYGWEFEIDGLTVYTTMRHRRKREVLHLLRTTFDDFPRLAPSYVFVDRKTKAVLPEQAWPPNVKHGDPDLPGICTPGTREFHQKWHATDTQYPWDPDRWTFLDTLQRIHAMMEHGTS